MRRLPLAWCATLALSSGVATAGEAAVKFVSGRTGAPRAEVRASAELAPPTAGEDLPDSRPDGMDSVPRQPAPATTAPADLAPPGLMMEPSPLPAAGGTSVAQYGATGSEPDATTNPFEYGTRQGSGLPASPYIAGLSYMMTPQPFRVKYRDRFYYPPAHFVRRCPYYPKGVYWGADWNLRFLPPNNLIHGTFRFNPYLSHLKAQHAAGGAAKGHRPHHVASAPSRAAGSSRRTAANPSIGAKAETSKAVR